MARRFIRPVLILILLFTASLILIRAQPYDDHELRDLLLPPGCPPPCLIDICPGITTVDDAVKRLKENNAVTDVRIVINDLRQAVIVSWWWKNTQSSINEVNDPLSLIGYMSDAPEIIVDNITIPTRVPFGLIHLMLGGGSEDTNYHNYIKWREPRPLYIGSTYRDLQIFVYGYIQGYPVTTHHYWNTPVSVKMGDHNLAPFTRVNCQRD
ncbi:MAG: hypothetical protein R3E39_31265 [Anaerolineae bacterium]